MALPKLNHATFELNVPGTGKKMKFRRTTFAEEKILLFAKESRDENDFLAAMKQVVGICAQDATFDENRVNIGAIEYLFLKIRAASINNITTLTITDNEDKKQYPFTIDLNDVEIDDSKTTDGLIKLTDDIAIQLIYPPASLYGDKTLNDEKDAYGELVVRCIDKIYDGESVIDPKTVKKDELKQWLDQIESTTFDKIREFIGNQPTLHYELKYTNANGKEKSVVLTKLSDFFTF